MLPCHWTDAEDQVVIANPDKTNWTLGRMLGKDMKTIYRRRIALGLAGLYKKAPSLVPPGASILHESRPAYRVPGWTIEMGAPCRSCSNYPPSTVVPGAGYREGGDGTVKDICIACESRVEWCKVQ